MAEFHTIKAYLYDNPLTENPNDFVARVMAEKSLTVDDVCQSAVKRGGADVPAAAIKHAVEIFFKEMAYRMCDGYSVNLEWINAQPVIKGAFYSAGEKFDRAKHSVGFEFHQGARLRRELAGVTVQIMGVADAGAFVAQVTDVKTGAVNDLVTPCRNLRITGSKIRIAGDKPENGVYFVPADGGERVKVDPSDIVTNNPSELLVVTPALAAGPYRVEIVTQWGSNAKTLLKEPRTVVFDRVLTSV